MTVVQINRPQVANHNEAPAALFNDRTKARAAAMLAEVQDDPVGRLALLEAASMLICAASLEDDEPVCMATALLDELAERTCAMLALCREVPDGAA